MAAVQYSGGKLHGAAEAKAMMRHACADERVKHKHSNRDLDKERTHKNTDLHRLSYQQMCDAYDKRIADYRAKTDKAIRKDAVTLFDLIISKPEALPSREENSWYRDVADCIDRHYGAQVVLDIKIHRDEIHEYTDADTGKKVMSRTHGHAFVFPEIDGKLCAKRFSSRKHMQELNQEIDRLTIEHYHCAFLTGERAVDRGYQTVEQLKRRSDEVEAHERAVQQRQEVERQIVDLECKIHDEEQQLAHLRQSLESDRKAWMQESRTQDLQHSQWRLTKRALKEDIDKLEQVKAELEQEVKEMYQSTKEQLRDRIEDLERQEQDLDLEDDLER